MRRHSTDNYMYLSSWIGITIAAALLVVVMALIPRFASQSHHDRFNQPPQSGQHASWLATYTMRKVRASGEKKNILLLHSYHKGLQWTDNVALGIEDALNKAGIPHEMYVEYMDTKRYPQMVHSPALVQMLREKYSPEILHLDLIIASDNNAYDFLVANKDMMFTDIPIVFCGINGLSPQQASAVKGMVGILEINDIEGTLKAAMNINPAAKTCYIINDRSTTGRAVKSDLLLQLEQANLPLNYIFLEDLTIDQLLKTVSLISDEPIILLMSWTMDAQGTYCSPPETIERLSEVAKVPIYAIWDVYLGNGAIGGSLTTGHDQGYEAGQLAVKIIRGKRPSEISPVVGTGHRYIFDYNQTKRFGVSKDSLPDGSLLINYPLNIFTLYPVYAFSTVTFMIFLSIVIVILIINVFVRKKIQKSLRENQVKLKDTVKQLASKNDELESIIYASHHDLRSPMVNINGFSYELDKSLDKLKDILSDKTKYSTSEDDLHEILDSEIAPEVDQITGNARKIFNLQSSLLEVSLIGQKPLRREHIDMNELIQSVLDEFSEVKDGNAGVFFYPVSDCIGDRELLKKAFHHLIDNAIRFRSDARALEIKISGSKDVNTVSYSIADNGIGIARQNFQDVFRLFYKVDPEKYSHGIGLGLTLVNRILMTHNGTVSLSSELGQGSTFTITLPLMHNMKKKD